MRKRLEKRQSDARFANICGMIIAASVYTMTFTWYFHGRHYVKASENNIIQLSLHHFSSTGEQSLTPQTETHRTQDSKKPQEQKTKATQRTKPLPKNTQESHIEKTQTHTSQSANPSQQASSAGEIDAYTRHVYDVIARHSYKLSRLKSAKARNEVSVVFHIDMDGNVQNVRVSRTCGDEKIDNAAVKIIQGISKDLQKPSKPYTMSVTLGLLR